MSCVSAAELRRFVATGQASAGFEAHVDGCARCAAALQGLARAAVASAAAPAPLRFPLEAAVAALALAVAVLAFPRPVLAPGSEPPEGGVPAAAVAWPSPPPPPALALDGGGAVGAR